MSQTVQKENLLNAEEIEKRETFGKRSARKTLQAGFIPATLTSSTLGPIHFSIKTKIMEKMIKSPAFFATALEIDISKFTSKENTGNIKILPKFIDFHPVNDYPIHIDFIHIQKETAILLIPIEITGADKASGLKKGGKLNIARYHVLLECDLSNIPEKIEINISGFGIGRSVFLSKIDLPKGCRLVKDYLILSIIGRGRKEKEEEAAAPTAAVAAAPTAKTEGKK
jgi:large subunit ribosomal protein L25